jgi:hypothetical protein
MRRWRFRRLIAIRSIRPTPISRRPLISLTLHADSPRRIHTALHSTLGRFRGGVTDGSALSACSSPSRPLPRSGLAASAQAATRAR